MRSKDHHRRSFIKMTAIAVVTGSAAVSARNTLAQEQEKLSEEDPTALALGYKEDTADVDAAKYPTHTKEQVCTACILYQGEDPDWGGCGAFPNKLVAGQGWCQVYAAKPA